MCLICNRHYIFVLLLEFLKLGIIEPWNHVRGDSNKVVIRKYLDSVIVLLLNWSSFGCFYKVDAVFKDMEQKHGSSGEYITLDLHVSIP